MRARGKAVLTNFFKTMKTEGRYVAIAQLARDKKVDVPMCTSQRYGPMTWHALRADWKRGMEFGSQTVARLFLAQSRAKLQQEAKNPVPIFCYPNWQFSDFGKREIQVATHLGMCGAVSVREVIYRTQ